MSVEAISWALAQPVKQSTAKFVLVVMANHADADMTCWPSIPHLIEQTAQDRKTVQENLRRLREWGYIEDTGARKGSTKQVPVYRLKTPENGPVSGGESSPESGGNTPENGPVKDAQKRDASESETGPNFPHNRPVFPTKQAQISHETGPKTGPGTVIKPSKEPSGNRHPRVKQQTLDTFVLPDWIPAKAWEGYLDMRKEKKKPPTERARDLVIAELAKLRAAGHDVGEVLNQSTRNNWTDVYAVKKPVVKAPQVQDQATLDAQNDEAFRLLYGKNQSEVIDV